MRGCLYITNNTLTVRFLANLEGTFGLLYATVVGCVRACVCVTVTIERKHRAMHTQIFSLFSSCNNINIDLEN